MADLPDPESNPWGAPDPELAQAAAWLHTHPDLGLGTLRAQAQVNDADRASGLTPGDPDWWVNKLQRGALAGTNMITSLASGAAGGLVDLAQGTRTGSIGPEGMGVLTAAVPLGVKPSGSLGMMAGRNATSASREAAGVGQLADAEALEGKATPDDIWKRTGWYRGEDNSWRFEIPDTGAKLTFGKYIPDGQLAHLMPPPGVPAGSSLPLDRILDHPALFKAYPELRDIPVGHLEAPPGNAMSYMGEKGPIFIAPDTKDAFTSTLLHEVQHVIQNKEGFARGGAPFEFLPPEFENWRNRTGQELNWYRQTAAMKGIDPHSLEQGFEGLTSSSDYARDTMNLDSEFLKRYQQMYHFAANLDEMSKTAFARYQNLGGEVEARNIQERFANPGLKSEFPLTGPRTMGFHKPLLLGNADRVPPSHVLQPVEHNPWVHEAEQVEYDPFAIDEPLGAK